jgi:hypothetical protein
MNAGASTTNQPVSASPADSLAPADLSDFSRYSSLALRTFSPECFRFHFGFALHPVYNLRAKNDFEILFSPVDTGIICHLFQACFISQEFTGSPGSAARNSCRDQNYLAGALVSEATRYRVVFDNMTPRSLCFDLPGA